MDGEHKAEELSLEKAAQLLARSGLMLRSAPSTPAYVQEVVDGLVELCAIDPQTGLGTRRRLETELAHLRGFVRRGLAVTVVAFSLEGLQQIGAPCEIGRLLRTVAGLIRAAVRDADVPGRLGDETFAVVLRGAAYGAAASAIIGRLQGCLAHGYFGEKTPAPRPHFGATAFLATETPEECIERALACLASAQRAGCDYALRP